METAPTGKQIIHYRGFILIQEHNKSWLVRPERSPMFLLPFRTPKCSVLEVKKILDLKLSLSDEYTQAA
tara:strand:- start:287 stop:493 length:207 start_codon:yes stop_codon:yes gene_type:complete